MWCGKKQIKLSKDDVKKHGCLSMKKGRRKGLKCKLLVMK